MVLVKKDLTALWGRKGARALLMLLPIFLMVVLPVVYFVAISLMPMAEGGEIPQGIAALLPESVSKLEYHQVWIEAFTTLLCPMLFLCVPLLTGAVSSACAFIVEKEEGTLETLMLSSMDVKSIFNAKITCCTILSCFISLIAFVAFFFTVTVADLMSGAPFFMRIDWLILLFPLMPVLSLFSVVFISLIIPRVYTTAEAMQTCSYLILPIVVLYLVQFTGVFRLHWAVLLLVAVLLGAASVVLYNISSRNFQAEKLFPQPVEIHAHSHPA